MSGREGRPFSGARCPFHRVVSEDGPGRPEHLFELRQTLECVEFSHTQVAACDHEIEARLARLEDQSGGQPLTDADRPRKARRAGPRFDAREHLHRLTGVDLTRIDGIDAPPALKVAAEIGLDMTPVPLDIKTSAIPCFDA